MVYVDYIYVYIKHTNETIKNIVYLKNKTKL